MTSKKEFMNLGDVNLSRLIDIGIALSAERNHARLMERILHEAMEFTNAEAGSLYLKNNEDELQFQIVHNKKLDIFLGGTSGKEISFPSVPLFTKEGSPNMNNISAAVAITGQVINIKDAYSCKQYDFSGTWRFDESTGYHSKSFLTVPLKNHTGLVIGVMQLLNAIDTETGDVTVFDPVLEPLIIALTSQASVSLENQLLLEAHTKLLEAFIELIAGTIDSKSPYTGAHCQRVPELTKLIAAAACDVSVGAFADFSLDEAEWYELHIAGCLHDCGKISMPEYVVDKATKLETIYDRINEVRMRFEVLKRDAEIDFLKARLAGGELSRLSVEFEQRIAKLDSDFAFIAECNVGGEFMASELIDRVKQIASQEWQRTLSDRLGISTEEMLRKKREIEPQLPVKEKLLDDRYDHIITREKADRIPSDNKWGFNMKTPEHKYNLGEVYNLSIGRGTLAAEDRYKINEHIIQTIIMLDSLPFPPHLRRVPEFAGGHHEKMDGTGYPKGLKKEEMSVPARILAIADIFEALTAADRPYKKPKSLSESIKIMGMMAKELHIDEDLFKLFLSSGVYKEYAERFLHSDQIDNVDLSIYLNN